MPKKKQPSTSIVLFKEKEVRRVWDEDQWWFSVIDVIEVLTLSKEPRKYWVAMKARIHDEGFLEVSTKCRRLKLEAKDGKIRATDCANTVILLRIIQSIPSPRAEPFKQWLAKVGAERLEEIENPEMLTERQRAYYKAKGYPDEWIEARMRGIQIRNELTEEWAKRGAKEGRDYAILTAEIAHETFEMIPSAHGDYKGLSDNENVRDHYTPLEVIFMALGEASTKAIHVSHDSLGFDALQEDAHQGGTIAGDARRQLEKATGEPVVSPENYLHLSNQQPSHSISESEPQQGKLIEDDDEES